MIKIKSRFIKNNIDIVQEIPALHEITKVLLKTNLFSSCDSIEYKSKKVFLINENSTIFSFEFLYQYVSISLLYGKFYPNFSYNTLELSIVSNSIKIGKAVDNKVIETPISTENIEFLISPDGTTITINVLVDNSTIFFN